MKIAYMRVSTDDQDLALQNDALKAVGCESFYREQGVSGSKRSRPELDKMLRDLKEGDIVYVWRLDRLGRSLTHLIELINLFRNKKVQFVSLNEHIDTTTAVGELIFHMIASFAQFERRVIGERVKAGKRSAMARGSKQGPKFKYSPRPDKTECSRSTWYRRQKRERQHRN